MDRKKIWNEEGKNKNRKNLPLMPPPVGNFEGGAITSFYSLCGQSERGWHQGQGRNSIEKWSMKKPWNGE